MPHRQEARDDGNSDQKVVPISGDYSEEEIRTNGLWNLVLLGLALIMIGIMYLFGGLAPGGAVVFAVMVLTFSWLYQRLFASSDAAKLDENSPGSGKRVGPLTMGTILGFLNDGFKR